MRYLTTIAVYGLFERHDDWSSCAWFYLDRPSRRVVRIIGIAA